MGELRHYWAVAIIATLAALIPTASVPAATPPPLSTYGKLPGVEMVAISPSGDRIAMVGVVDNVRNLIVLDQDKKAAQTFAMENTKIRGLYWAGEDRVLLRKSDTTKLDGGFITEKVELTTMIVIPLNGEKPWAVFGREPRIKGGVRRFLGIQAREGRYFGYFSGTTYGGDFRSPDLYLVSGGPVL